MINLLFYHFMTPHIFFSLLTSLRVMKYEVILNSLHTIYISQLTPHPHSSYVTWFSCLNHMFQRHQTLRVLVLFLSSLLEYTLGMLCKYFCIIKGKTYCVVGTVGTPKWIIWEPTKNVDNFPNQTMSFCIFYL